MVSERVDRQAHGTCILKVCSNSHSAGCDRLSKTSLLRTICNNLQYRSTNQSWKETRVRCANQTEAYIIHSNFPSKPPSFYKYMHPTGQRPFTRPHPPQPPHKREREEKNPRQKKNGTPSRHSPDKHRPRRTRHNPPPAPLQEPELEAPSPAHENPQADSLGRDAHRRLRRRGDGASGGADADNLREH